MREVGDALLRCARCPIFHNPLNGMVPGAYHLAVVVEQAGARVGPGWLQAGIGPCYDAVICLITNSVIVDPAVESIILNSQIHFAEAVG